MVSTRHMKIRTLISLFLLAGFSSILTAEIPRKAPITRYTGLWTNSPFTSKPPPVAPTSVDNPLDDFTLAGIAPVPGGYRITIVNKKDLNDVIVIDPSGSSDFKLVSVSRNPEVSLGTTVVLSADGKQGTVTFEPDLITLNKPPAAPEPQPEKNQDPRERKAAEQEKQKQAAANNKNKQEDSSRNTQPRIVGPSGRQGGSTTQTRERSRR